MTKLEQYILLKEEVIQEIINNPNISNKKKIFLLTKHGLGEIEPFISKVFKKWEKECSDKEELTAIASGLIKGKDYICSFSDTPFLDAYEEEKYVTIYFRDIIKNLNDKIEDNLILVATSRGDFNSKIYKTKQEVIDHIFNYMIENKVIGFKLDW